MIATTLLLLGLLPSPFPQEAEEVRMVHMLVNGDFSVAPEDLVPGGIPWWIRRGDATRVETRAGENWLVTESGSYAIQPVPAYAPYVDRLLIKGRVEGVGRLTVIDGRGERASLTVGQAGQITAFEWRGSDVAKVLGHAPLPRLNLALDAPEGTASWTDLSVEAAFPFPTEAAMRQEVVDRLHYALDPWVERSVDQFGPRPTGLFCSVFDAITGESIYVSDAGFHPLADNLMDALAHEPDAKWEAALNRFIADFFELCLHPETGLPRQWDPRRDVPLDEKFLEIHVALRFLLDVHERGPVAFRDQALIAAKLVGTSAVRQGVLPDGNIASLYRPSDGAASNATRMIRRLDMSAQLTRLAAVTKNKDLLDSTRAAVATVLYTHFWPGSWNRIDPGFDDDFGHYAARAGLMAKCYPDESLFRRVIDTGWEKYRVLWRQSLKFGGSMAADQVRCWKLLLAYSELRPELREDLDGLLLGAVHSHLRGQQYGSGAWGDVTYYGFQPAVDLQVGDLPGTPSNLLEGLAMVYGSGLGHSDEDLRALFTGILRSSMDVYGREYGLITSMREIDGANNAGGSIRIAPALTLLLSKLDGAR